MSLGKFSVDNPVCVNLIMVLIVVMGVFLYQTRMPKEIFPEFSARVVTITTIYPGASTEEVEKNVTIRIEDAVAELDGVDELMSTSQENRSTVSVKVADDEDDMPGLIGDIQQVVDRIDNFPDDAEDPDVREVEASWPVITVSLFGDVNLVHLKTIVDDLKDEIAGVNGVAEVRISGLPERELWVEVDPAALERYSLSMGDVVRAVSSQNLDLPGGTLPTAQGEFLIRTKGKAEEAARLSSMVVRTTPSGGAVRVGDVARVRDWFERASTIGRFNQRRAVNLSVIKSSSGDAIKVSRAVRDLVDSYRGRLPATVDVGVFNDISVYINNRLQVMLSSGMQGLVIVFGFLLLMLNLRTSLMVTMGIPISFLGAIIIMFYSGMTMNMMSMFSMIVVLGMVVDDAVVIGENIYRHYESGLSPREAAIRGTREVTLPVIAAVSTTMAAFLPLLLLPGTMGVFLGVIPKVVSFALLVSLLEALVILPSHMAEYLPEKPPEPSRFRKRLNGWFESLTRWYGARLDHVLNWRYAFMAGVVGFTVVLVTYAATHVPFVLFGAFEGSQFFINVEADPRSALEDTEALIREMEETVAATIPEAERVSMVTNVGTIMDDENAVRFGPNYAQIIVELVELGQGRKTPIREVIERVREATAGFSREADIQFKEMQGGPGGSPIYVQVTGRDMAVLAELGARIRRFVAEIPGASDVKDNLEAGKPELQIRLRPEAYALGLTDAGVASEVRAAFWGAKAASFQTATEDIDVRVKYPEEARTRVEGLLTSRITLPGGGKVPLMEVADVVKVRGMSSIVRDERMRAVSITGELDQAKTTAQEVAEAVAVRFADDVRALPGYSLATQKGEVKDINESMAALGGAFLLGLLVIYFILGTQFRSYVQPLIVMSAIPFGIDGVILGHIVLGKNLGLLSIIGLVALSGIVVNDSLVLVDFVNKRRADGANRRTSLVEAGMLRLRPVLLTSLTTMGGLFFLAFFAKGQARFLSPMAVSIFFGLMASTVITLVVVPCLYAILDDAAARVGVWRRSLTGRRGEDARSGAES